LSGNKENRETRRKRSESRQDIGRPDTLETGDVEIKTLETGHVRDKGKAQRNSACWRIFL